MSAHQRQNSSKAAQQIVLAGEVVEVAVVDAADADLFARITDEDMLVWLALAGMEAGSQHIAESLQAMNENGYDLPNAWAEPVRSELIEIGIGAGFVSGLCQVFQKQLVLVKGTAFVRRMQGGEKTDQQYVTDVLKAKHAPLLPAVTADTGFAPQPNEWAAKMQEIVGWLRPHDPLMATAVGQIRDDANMDEAALAVPLGSARAIALGTVLRSTGGLGDLKMIIPQSVLDSGDGLSMLWTVQKEVFAHMDDSLVELWQHPVPVSELYLVKAAALEWDKQRDDLRSRQRYIVDDPREAKLSAERLFGGNAVLKSIINNLKLNHGTQLTYQQIMLDPVT